MRSSAPSFSHVPPRSSLRKSPPSPSPASTSAQTRSGRAGEAATPMRPFSEEANPGPSLIRSQESPPSVLQYRPLPEPPLTICHGRRTASHIAA